MQTASRIAMIALCLCLAASAQGATWRVEHDGSGDFEVIQDAVDAAAPGDVIIVGPGRYQEFQVWNDEIRDWHFYVLIETDDLTIIGSGPETTIIGPEDNRPYPRLIMAMDLNCSDNFSIRNIVTGVLPAPPAIIFPVDMTGTGNCCTLNNPKS